MKSTGSEILRPTAEFRIVPHWRLVRLSLLMVVLAACSGQDRDAAVEVLERSAGRDVREVPLDTLFLLQSDVNDTLFLNPRLLTADSSGVYAYDYFDSRVKAFSPNGELRWMSGGQGAGPGEFGNAVGLSTAPDGTVWIVDGGLGRVAGLSAAGEDRELFEFPAGRPINSLVALPDRQILTLIGSTDFWIERASDGSPGETGQYPLREIHEAAGAARQVLTASAPRSSRWAAIFPVGDLLLVYEGSQLQCAGRLVEGEPLPGELRGPPVFWGVAISMSDSSVYILARGATDDALRIVDEYSAEHCRYTRSLRLPVTANAMTQFGSVFYLFSEEPEQQLIAVQPDW